MTTTQAKERSDVRYRLVSWISLSLALASTICAIVISAWYFRSRPAWELSASASRNGVQVHIYKTGAVAPTYSTFLDGHSIPRDVKRVERGALPLDVGQTLDYDDTLGPGYWTLCIDGVELDISVTRMTVDGKEDNKSEAPYLDNRRLTTPHTTDTPAK